MGDRVLEKSAEIFKSTMRPTDFVGRTGGDEFVVVLADDLAILLNSLGITPLAEGVESADEVAILEELRCAIVQGYHIARPMAFDEVKAWAKARAAATDGIV